jgi:hypothetical protein
LYDPAEGQESTDSDHEESGVPYMRPNFIDNDVDFVRFPNYPKPSEVAEPYVDGDGEIRVGEVMPLGNHFCLRDKIHALQIGQSILWEVINIEPAMVQNSESYLGDED